MLGPPLKVQLPPFMSATPAVIDSQSLGLVTVMLPVTCQPLSVKPPSVATTV